MKTSVWFRYDNDNLYIAAKVIDPTGHYNQFAYDIDNIWNGDTFEIFVDPEGPNSGMLNYLGADYNWETTPFDQRVFTPTIMMDSPQPNDFIKNEVWTRDMHKKNKFSYSIDSDDGQAYGWEQKAGKEYGNPAEVADLDGVAIKTVPNGDGTYTTSYEIKIPWEDILRTYGSKADMVVPGKTFGCSVGVTDAYEMDMVDGWRMYDSCYCWGAGMFGRWGLYAPLSCGGTNAITLSDVEITPFKKSDVELETEAPETEPAGETVQNELTVVKVEKDDGNIGLPIFFKSEYADATSLTYSFTYNYYKFDYEYVSGPENFVEGVDYTVSEADKGAKLIVTILNPAKFAALAVDDQMFEVILSPEAELGISGLEISCVETIAKVANTPGNNGGNNSGSSDNKEPVIKEENDKVEIKDEDVVEEVVDNYSIFKLPVNSKANYKTALSLSYTFAFDAEKFELQGIEGLDEADYKLEKLADGSYKLTITNIAKVKAAATGTKLFDVVVKAASGVSKEDLLNEKAGGLKIEDACKFEAPSTGDNMLVVAIIAAAMLACCAVVVSRKRRYN